VRQKFMNWFAGLSRGAKVILGIAVVFIIGLAGGGTDEKQIPPDPQNASAKTQQQETKKPVVTTKTETVEEPIPFENQTQNNASMNKGETRIATIGVVGVKATSFTVTFTDGIETNRQLLSDTVVKSPVHQVTYVGTYVPAPTPEPAASSSGCNPNYSGCVPNASDVDCAGGSGDGPAYAHGPIRILGGDPYRLDRDGDGIACD
jgi:hypothetical protein